MTITLEKLTELRHDHAAKSQTAVDAFTAHQKAVAASRLSALALGAALDDFLGLTPAPKETPEPSPIPSPAPAAPPAPEPASSSSPEPETFEAPAPAVASSPTQQGQTLSGMNLTGR